MAHQKERDLLRRTDHCRPMRVRGGKVARCVKGDLRWRSDPDKECKHYGSAKKEGSSLSDWHRKAPAGKQPAGSSI
ncbi:hypothetical protein KSC_043100 [Ktedonobacter sp. SOSP1-52]|nr:hypothetical protein KSC_043100 [Ktedonobacter sp. SOSP1-52]